MIPLEFVDSGDCGVWPIVMAFIIQCVDEGTAESRAARVNNEDGGVWHGDCVSGGGALVDGCVEKC